jgi:phosphoribosylformimino-5-aminoimidazole carboxamide ribonucleotide (ProFAR) isomerase
MSPGIPDISSQVFEILPALDIENGKLSQSRGQLTGEYSEIATLLQDISNAGLTSIHLVDLDLAFSRGENFGTIKKIIESTPLRIQISGGIRTAEQVKKYLELRIGRINLDGIWLTKLAEISEISVGSTELAIALDLQGEEIVSRGTGQSFGPWRKLIADIPNEVSNIIVTDNKRDGKLSGVDIDLYSEIVELANCSVIASGGVHTISDLQDLKSAGVSGAVVGKAIYSGAITFKELADVTL